MPNKAYIDKYFGEVNQIVENISREEVNGVIEILFDAWKQGKHIFLMGNGGSASTATHFASDLLKTATVSGKKRFKAISLNDNIPLVSAWTNDEGFENVYAGQLENFLQEGDVVVGFSVHGGSGSGNAGQWSQNLMRAMQYAKDNGARTIGFAGFDGGAMKRFCDACVVVPMDSTPHVEGFHLVLQHLIVFALKEKITKHDD